MTLNAAPRGTTKPARRSSTTFDQEGVGGRPDAVPEVLTGTERSEIACPKDSPAGVAHRGQQMRIVSLIDEEDVIEGILRHPRALARGGARVHSGTDPPGETTLDPWLDDPFPDYDTEPVVAFSAS
jgi:hypothetical protein